MYRDMKTCSNLQPYNNVLPVSKKLIQILIQTMLYHYQKQRFDIRKETRCVCVGVCVGVYMDVCTVHVCVREIQQHMNTEIQIQIQREGKRLINCTSVYHSSYV